MLRRVLFAAALAALSACGAPSSLDICHALCDTNRRCGDITDAHAQNCHSDCDTRRGQLQDIDTAEDKNCKNAGDVRKQLLNCLNQECNKVNGCVQQVDNTCVRR